MNKPDNTERDGTGAVRCSAWLGRLGDEKLNRLVEARFWETALRPDTKFPDHLMEGEGEYLRPQRWLAKPPDRKGDK